MSNTSSRWAKNRYRTGVVFIVVFLGMTALLAIGMPSCKKEYFLRYRGGDGVKLRAERTYQLQQIWAVIAGYQSRFGEWPENLNELRLFDPTIDALLSAPRYSAIGDYQIDFGYLNGGAGVVVVEDPGYHWPGRRIDPGRTQPGMESDRCVLLRSGEITLREFVFKRVQVDGKDEFVSLDEFELPKTAAQ